MTDPLSLIRLCRDSPGDYTALLIAADYFDDPDEGDDAELARALRWMAEHQKYPLAFATPAETGTAHSPPVRDWHWFHNQRTDAPFHARLPHQFIFITGYAYASWLDAVLALARCPYNGALAIDFAPNVSL